MTITKRAINGRLTNPVGLGCMSLSWAYGVPPSDEDGAKLLHRALDLGYDHLDTARIYGLGHNETLIGKTLKDNRDKFFLASKTGIIVDGEKRRIDCKPETIRKACDESLRLLQTDHIDLYYLHRRDFETPIEDSVGTLVELIKEGKIGSIGLSEMSAETLRKASAVHPIAAMQTEYSLWTRNPEIAVLEACKDVGTTFVAFSPVGRGALAAAVASALDYVGVFTAEFFASAQGPVFNEIAPRVHNSGHWTIEGAATSQFENHIRAICGLPLGATDTVAERVEMENLIGDDGDRFEQILSDPAASLHLYGKAEARPGRKIGHVTRLYR